ncbi:AAA family ATPase [Streptomyces sp. NPDC102476]|uniref:AAA family ATPase n=1 Tax=Streptomyces sp. NPDC102476 TaxID=3366181 RepID=UPI0037FCC05D
MTFPPSSTAGPPPWSTSDLQTIHALKSLGRHVAAQFVGRRLALDLLEVAVIAHEHVLLLGPPGTGKTDLISQFAKGLGTDPFVRLLTRFTEPAEVFGPVDIKSFRAGSHRVRTEGMLPEAHIAFLDEIFQSGSPILNTLLTVMNERLFHHGQAAQEVPLISLIGASNAIPQDPSLLAFADRFLLRLRLAPVADTRLEELIGRAFTDAAAPARAEHARVDLEGLKRLGRQLSKVDLGQVIAPYQALTKELMAQGVSLSDRRIVRGPRLVAAAAMRATRVRAEPQDLWPLRHFWSDPLHEGVVAEAVRRIAGVDEDDPESPPDDAHQLLIQAKLMVRQLGPAPTRAALLPVLHRLNSLRLRMERADPHNTATRQELTTIIDNAIALLPR